jgi:hypothetical protein
MDVPGFTTLIYHGGLDTIEFPADIPQSNECDSCGNYDQRVTRYALGICLLCGMPN